MKKIRYYISVSIGHIPPSVQTDPTNGVQQTDNTSFLSKIGRFFQKVFSPVTNLFQYLFGGKSMSDKTGISERDITISEPTNFRHNRVDFIETENGTEIRLTPLDVQPTADKNPVENVANTGVTYESSTQKNEVEKNPAEGSVSVTIAPKHDESEAKIQPSVTNEKPDTQNPQNQASEVPKEIVKESSNAEQGIAGSGVAEMQVLINAAAEKNENASAKKPSTEATPVASEVAQDQVPPTKVSAEPQAPVAPVAPPPPAPQAPVAPVAPVAPQASLQDQLQAKLNSRKAKDKASEAVKSESEVANEQLQPSNPAASSEVAQAGVPTPASQAPTEQSPAATQNPVTVAKEGAPDKSTAAQVSTPAPAPQAPAAPTPPTSTITASNISPKDLSSVHLKKTPQPQLKPLDPRDALMQQIAKGKANLQPLKDNGQGTSPAKKPGDNMMNSLMNRIKPESEQKPDMREGASDKDWKETETHDNDQNQIGKPNNDQNQTVTHNNDQNQTGENTVSEVKVPTPKQQEDFAKALGEKVAAIRRATGGDEDNED